MSFATGRSNDVYHVPYSTVLQINMIIGIKSLTRLLGFDIAYYAKLACMPVMRLEGSDRFKLSVVYSFFSFWGFIFVKHVRKYKDS